MVVPNRNESALQVAQIVETMTMGGAENLAVRLANELSFAVMLGSVFTAIDSLRR